MMAPDRSHPSNGDDFPSPETLEILRTALTRYLGGAREDEQICEALGVLAEEAKQKRLTGEKVLIAFKQVWYDLPAILSIRDQVERKSVLDHLVKLCIDTVYRR